MHLKYDDQTAAEIELLKRMNQAQFGDRFAAVETEVTRHPVTGRIMKSRVDNDNDSNLTVTFSVESRFNKRLSTLEGKPIWDDVDMITIVAPGQAQMTTVHSQVTDYYQWRFPVEYKQFKENRETLTTGTPLDVWPVIGPSELLSLKAKGIRTVQQLATLPESVDLQGAHALRAKATEFLKLADDTAAQAALQVKLKERDDEMVVLRAQMEQMQHLVASMAAGKAEPAESKAKGK